METENTTGATPQATPLSSSDIERIALAVAMLLEKERAEHTREIEQAEQRGYLRGRNEAIELKMEEWQTVTQPPKSSAAHAPDSGTDKNRHTATLPTHTKHTNTMSHNNIITTPENPQAVTAVAGAPPHHHPRSRSITVPPAPTPSTNASSKIRPMATPLDQLSRCGGARRSSSMQSRILLQHQNPSHSNSKDITLAGIQTEQRRPPQMQLLDRRRRIPRNIRDNNIPGLPGTADTGPLTAYIAAKASNSA